MIYPITRYDYTLHAFRYAVPAGTRSYRLCAVAVFTLLAVAQRLLRIRRIHPDPPTSHIYLRSASGSCLQFAFILATPYQGK